MFHLYILFKVLSDGLTVFLCIHVNMCAGTSLSVCVCVCTHTCLCVCPVLIGYKQRVLLKWTSRRGVEEAPPRKMKTHVCKNSTTREYNRQVCERENRGKPGPKFLRPIILQSLNDNDNKQTKKIIEVFQKVQNKKYE